MGLESDPLVRNRWKNAFRMFDGTNKIKVKIQLRDESGALMVDEQNKPIDILYGEDALEAERHEIETDFFYKVPGYGVVICNRPAGSSWAASKGSSVRFARREAVAQNQYQV